MPSCAVPTCKNAVGRKKKEDGITFHVFPSDAIRKERWIKIIQKTRLDDSWKPSDVSVVCSEHFRKEDMYVTGFGLRRLKLDAIPSSNMVYASGPSKKKVRRPLRRRVKTATKSKNVKSRTPLTKPQQLKSDLIRLSTYCEKYSRMVKTMYIKVDKSSAKHQNFEAALNKVKDMPINKELLCDLFSDNILTAKDLIHIKNKILSSNTSNKDKKRT